MKKLFAVMLISLSLISCGDSGSETTPGAEGVNSPTGTNRGVAGSCTTTIPFVGSTAHAQCFEIYSNTPSSGITEFKNDCINNPHPGTTWSDSACSQKGAIVKCQNANGAGYYYDSIYSEPHHDYILNYLKDMCEDDMEGSWIVL